MCCLSAVARRQAADLAERQVAQKEKRRSEHQALIRQVRPMLRNLLLIYLLESTGTGTGIGTAQSFAITGTLPWSTHSCLAYTSIASPTTPHLNARDRSKSIA
jgi:hypothetical protein